MKEVEAKAAKMEERHRREASQKAKEAEVHFTQLKKRLRREATLKAKAMEKKAAKAYSETFMRIEKTTKLIRTVRIQLKQNNFKSARQVFMQIPDLENQQHRPFEEILEEDYMMGPFDADTLTKFLNEIPNPQWVLSGLEILLELNKTLRAQEYVPSQHSKCSAMGPTIRAVIEGGDFKFKSVSRDELVYAPINAYKHDSERRNVFTWIPAWYPDEQKKEWRIIKSHTADNLFYIQSVWSSEYLYATKWGALSRDTEGREQSRVFLWRHNTIADQDDMCHWELVLVDHDKFAFFKAHRQSFLHASDYSHDNDRRYVRAAKEKGEPFFVGAVET